MGEGLTFIYRGFLESCNYTCYYCPFSKKRLSINEQNEDEKALFKFINWIDQNFYSDISVFFTPKGEALIHSWYKEAIILLSHSVEIKKVVIQTNLSMDLQWLEKADISKVVLWCTYHPDIADRKSFLDKSNYLHSIGISHSVGIVGVKEHFDEIEAVRKELNDNIYLWINAYKSIKEYYTDQEISVLSSIDPLFTKNLQVYKSKGLQCRCGESVFSIDGNGDVKQCHFVNDIIGNIYNDDINNLRKKQSFCPNDTCHCHIGYVHMYDLNLYNIYFDNVLGRIPLNFIGI